MPVPIIVINFGHSVLRSLEDYTDAASEIYRHYRKGYNVVAVTSAQGDQTDILMAEARRVGPEFAKNLPELVQLGERRSAALLSLALERIGAPAFVRQARDLGLKARGPATQAELLDIDTEQLRQDLKNHDIVVMPGYVGIGENDRPALLGDGGADLTALFVASRLGVPALLLKDVDGVYEADPKKKDGGGGRFDAVSWDETRRRASVLISPKALNFAEENQFAFDIGRPGIPFYTRIGADMSASKPAVKARPLRIAMMGCGVVGGGVYRRVKAHSGRFKVSKILVRDIQKYLDQGYEAELLTTDFEDLLAAQPDIFIDVSGPVDPALGFTQDMLSRGVHVVSANKQAIAAGGQALLGLAQKGGVILASSSAAGGGMPILEMCQREAGRIIKVEALLNGTTNYMLGEITNGKSYDEALIEAQEKGFAEADPTADVSGADAAAKLRLIALLGFGEELSGAEIPLDTIEGFSLPEGKGQDVFKRVGSCWRHKGGVNAVLELKVLSKNDFLARAEGEEAHAVFYFEDGESYKIRGKGAGRWPTTEAIMADLYDISSAIAFS